MEEPVRLGVAAMDRKMRVVLTWQARSKPMQNILNRLLLTNRFEVVTFGDKLTDQMILDEDVESWPIVDVLISFFSTGFPLDKAIKYVALRGPVCVNDLNMQTVLWDRRAVLGILRASSVPTPRSVFANRDGGPQLSGELLEDLRMRVRVDTGLWRDASVVELVDYDTLVVDGQTIRKPFVEKPVSGEDHNVHIYFSQARGGGGRRLFRKVGNKSSEFDPEMSVPRMHGSYIYEEFMDVDNAEDIKVYTIGPNFAHAETRKSPVVDGLVKRNPDGKEIRYITQLSPEERQMAHKISFAFKQFICGFDLLRTGNRSYVIDVNGWSFVKGNDQYYDKCAEILHRFCRERCIPRSPRRPSEATKMEETSSWVLKANVTVFRHGDRTPKQKLKRSFKANDPAAAPILALLHDCREEIILRQQLNLVSDALEEACALPGADADDLRFVMDIIERKKSFPGTKIQMKPSFSKATGELEKMQLVVKWGGEFSHAALHQARDYGTNMRRDMLIMNKEALDNCTVYTSSERRVSSSAEVFADAFLGDDPRNGDGPHPRKEMIVCKDLLDDSNAAKDLMDHVKEELKQRLRPDSPTADERPDAWPADLPTPAHMGTELRMMLLSLRETMRENFRTLDVDAVQERWCTHETPVLFRERWENRLIQDFDEKPSEPSRASELAEMLSHDGLHNRLFLETIFTSSADKDHRFHRLHRLYRMSLALFAYVCPREYGITPEEKEQIGRLTSMPLLQSILHVLVDSLSEKGLCALYFTKESHVHTLLNLILSSDLPVIMPRMPPLDYFSSITFEVYERERLSYSSGTSPAASATPHGGASAADGALSKPERSLVISVSEGAHSSEVLFINLDARHALTPLPSRRLISHMDFDEAIAKLSSHCTKDLCTNIHRGQIEGATHFFGEKDEDQRVVPIRANQDGFQ
ncbi:inositol hexakisphosphate and diphosphoinositol-pentakisphosphate kinase [Malassezia sp. CBS 17886]|nr:inositol hexakisphosphate and diphosphoinositol-pentakisphosphate kinase [Malassezia sp. CBS 17886]